MLDLLCAVYEAMSDRDGVSDPWLQRRVSVPGSDALDAYMNKLQMFNERYEGEPLAPETVRQVFRQDGTVGR